MLAELDEGDDAMVDLWNLWFHERGSKAAAQLAKAEELTSQGPLAWPDAERILEDLIVQYGVYFTEPVNRLATLYYMQDRLEESERLCNIVLDCKPWHFGALSGIVMVHAGLRNVNAARLWAARRLPTYVADSEGVSINRRRRAWVMRALRDAEQSLVDAEKRVHVAFGKPDEHATTGGSEGPTLDGATVDHDDDDDDDAWQ